MGNTLRIVGALAVGVLAGFLGPGAFSATQFALGYTLFSMVLPPKVPRGKPKSERAQGTSVGTPMWQVFGEKLRAGGDLLRCGLDADGNRAGVEQVERTEGSGGGGSGGGGGGGGAVSTVSYLHASFGLAAGYNRIEKIYSVDSKNGERVIWDMNGLTPDDRGLDLTEVLGSVSGTVIGYLGTKVHLWFGTEEQEPDSFEELWYPDGVSADRGITKIVFDGFGPLELDSSFKFLLVNDLTNRRDIITYRLKQAGIPESRINLRSIDPDAEDVGWWVEDKEPAINLVNQVAAKSFHDVSFLPAEAGACFTDISRANPSYFVLEEEELGAFTNTGGTGKQVSSGDLNIEGTEVSPRSLAIGFEDKGDNYKETEAITYWATANGKPEVIKLNAIGYAQEFQDLCDTTMTELHGAKGTHNLSLMPNRSQICKGCVVIVPERSALAPTGTRYLRVVRRNYRPDGSFALETTPYDPAAYGRHKTIEEANVTPPGVVSYVAPSIKILDSVALTDDMATKATVLMIAAVPRGSLYSGVYISTESNAFDPMVLGARGHYGELLTNYEYSAAQVDVFNYVNTLRVRLDDGGLTSAANEAAVLEGANVLFLGTIVSGVYEGIYIQFVTATPVPAVGGVLPGTYDITGLLPGVFASDFDLNIPAGALVVKITNHIGNRQAGVNAAIVKNTKLNVGITYEAHQQADPTKSTGNVAATIRGQTLVPVTVHHTVLMEDDGAGGYDLAFMARSRYAESYQAFLDGGVAPIWSDPLSFTLILKNAGVTVDTRTVTANSQTGLINVNYSAADLTTWFGAVPDNLSGTIQQAGTYFPGRIRTWAATS